MTADIVTNSQIFNADDYKQLIVGTHNGTAVRLQDVAEVVNSTQDLRTAGYTDGVRSITVFVFRQPGANIIETVDRVRAQLPFLQAVLPQGVKFTIVLDRTTTIRASVDNVERTLITSICLVVVVVFIFLRTFRSTIIPAVAVPVSLWAPSPRCTCSVTASTTCR
jgi:multidrug efflux pump